MIGSCRDCFKNDVCKSHKDNPRVLVCNAWEELLFRRPVEFPCRFYDIFEFAIKNDMNKHITGDFIYPEFFKEYDVHETVMCSDCGTAIATITAIIDQNGYVYCYDCANMYGIDLPGDDSHEFVRDVNGFVEKVRKNLLKEDQKDGKESEKGEGQGSVQDGQTGAVEKKDIGSNGKNQQLGEEDGLYGRAQG